MGTKNEPGEFDCYANAEPDEPMFVLLARDASAPASIEEWAEKRAQDIRDGVKPESDWPMVKEARECAGAMREWRKRHRDNYKPVVAKGDLVTCTNGHVIGEALRDIKIGDLDWGSAFGNWRQADIPTPGYVGKPPCAICGAAFIHPDPGSWSMHFEDGWRPDSWPPGHPEHPK